MNGLMRWAKFNLVGVLGMGVQLGSLALLNRALPGHYLWTSAVALEVTLWHNFLWHRRFTWRDRPLGRVWPQLWRFHLANGLVSLVGNLMLMRLLVQRAHLPVVVANLVAIVCCSLANFCLTNQWAFASSSSLASPGNPRRGFSQAPDLGS